MKNNFKISALIAALELCVSANLLYKFSLCPMWMVILPLVVAVAVGVLALACKCEKLSGAAWILGEVVLCVTTFLLYRYSTLSILALALPVALSAVASVALLLTKGNYVTAAAIVGTAMAALQTYLLYQYTLVSLVLVALPVVVAVAGLVCHLFINCSFKKGAGILAALVTFVAYYLLKKNSILPAHEVSLQLLVVLAVYAMVVVFARWDGIRESLRKGMVSLKRSPQTIPLVMLFISFLYYSLNLTDVSDTTAKIQLQGMGLCGFCIMLFSLLSLVCMLNAFPRRKKANVPMIVLMYLMFALIIFCDSHYNTAILTAVNRTENPIPISDYIVAAQNMLVTHRIMMVVTAVLVALLPVYSKLLKKINTSVEVADNGEMAQIELND